MQIDKAVIPHCTGDLIPWDELTELVKLNKKYLNEKKTWYKLNGNLEYFKIRDDLRIFNELFFQKFAATTLKLDTLIYRLAYIKERNPLTKESNNSSTLGLLSENFQKPGYNYYLVSELLNSKYSDLCAYGGFSLVTLLNFFKDITNSQEYEMIKDFLIRLFIIDALLLQVDRNAHNIGFEIPSLKDIPYTKRLRPTILSKQFDNLDGIVDLSTAHSPKLIGMKPSKVYDNERILNIDHNNVFLVNPRNIWTPLFAFSEDLAFPNQERAKEVSEKGYSGLDPNIAELYLTYTTESKNYLDQLAYDDIYRKILEEFSHPNDPICLSRLEREKIERTIQKRQRDIRKVLMLG